MLLSCKLQILCQSSYPPDMNIPVTCGINTNGAFALCMLRAAGHVDIGSKLVPIIKKRLTF